MAEPVTVEQLAAHLRIDAAAESTELESLIETARDFAERITGRSIIRRQLIATFDRIPCANEKWWDGVREGIERPQTVAWISLPRAAPLVSVDQFTTYDNADVATNADIAALFIVDRSTENRLGRICLRDGQTWPLWTRPEAGIEVTYTAGWTQAACPPMLKRAILMMAAWLYANRGDCDGCAEQCGAMSAINAFILPRV